LHLMALALAIAPSPVASAAPASPSPAPAIATAKPSVIATPQDTKSLVLPPAPDIEPAFRGSDAPLPPGGIAGSDEPFVGLALEDAVNMALLRNTDLAIAQTNRRIAGYQVVAVQGAYDVRLQVEPTYEVAVQPPTSPFNTGPGGGPITQITAGATAGFAGATTTGGNYRIFTSAQRVDNNNIFNGYNPYYLSSIGFTFTQPLARNLAIDDTRRQLQISRIGRDLSTDTALLEASNTVDNVLNAYYNLVAAWRNVTIQEDALRQAKAQEESNSRLVRRGAAAPVDVAESDAQVQQFQSNVYSAIANVSSLQNQLKALVLGNPGDPLWTANLVPTSPVTTIPVEPAVNDLVVAALQNRPEVAQLRENIREENVNLAYAKDQTLPQIDLNAGVTENGFAGAPQNLTNTPLFSVLGQTISNINALVARANALDPSMPLIPINAGLLNPAILPGTIGTIGQSYNTAFHGDFPQYSISATLSFPLRNRTAEADFAIEKERRRSLQTQEVALIERLQMEARNAVQDYRSARSRLVAATAGRKAAETVAASELRKFKAGASTTFLVLQRQVALANARGSELQAQTDLERALVELDRVSGNILSANHIDATTLGTGPAGHVPDLTVPAK
jgi:outer membrane protein